MSLKWQKNWVDSETTTVLSNSCSNSNVCNGQQWKGNLAVNIYLSCLLARKLSLRNSKTITRWEGLGGVSEKGGRD